jgi:hypothetical protein
MDVRRVKQSASQVSSLPPFLRGNNFYDGAMVRLTFFTLDQLYDDSEATFEKIAQFYHSTAEKPVAEANPPGVIRR